ncbi:uncharacterized protein LOC115887906 isoform X1 [Sitophilus oryzae]|uniref:Uncharacterized protein LOC115887906 isoform X1 n=1 Tax=Sitophilus oryzae TaxID=7048 RepID=A0A6J2YK98_SITOR|nr:uncharacterized protein LOC115887906 isoform X1 [Sitophilus oryzae]
MEGLERIKPGLYRKVLQNNVASFKDKFKDVQDRIGALVDVKKPEKLINETNLKPKLRKSMIIRNLKNSDKNLISSTPYHKATKEHFFENNTSAEFLSPIRLGESIKKNDKANQDEDKEPQSKNEAVPKKLDASKQILPNKETSNSDGSSLIYVGTSFRNSRRELESNRDKVEDKGSQEAEVLDTYDLHEKSRIKENKKDGPVKVPEKKKCRIPRMKKVQGKESKRSTSVPTPKKIPQKRKGSNSFLRTSSHHDISNSKSFQNSSEIKLNRTRSALCKVAPDVMEESVRSEEKSNRADGSEEVEKTSDETITNKENELAYEEMPKEKLISKEVEESSNETITNQEIVVDSEEIPKKKLNFSKEKTGKQENAIVKETKSDKVVNVSARLNRSTERESFRDQLEKIDTENLNSSKRKVKNQRNAKSKKTEKLNKSNSVLTGINNESLKRRGRPRNNNRSLDKTGPTVADRPEQSVTTPNDSVEKSDVHVCNNRKRVFTQSIGLSPIHDSGHIIDDVIPEKQVFTKDIGLSPVKGNGRPQRIRRPVSYIMDEVIPEKQVFTRSIGLSPIKVAPSTPIQRRAELSPPSLGLLLQEIVERKRVAIEKTIEKIKTRAVTPTASEDTASNRRMRIHLKLATLDSTQTSRRGSSSDESSRSSIASLVRKVYEKGAMHVSDRPSGPNIYDTLEKGATLDDIQSFSDSSNSYCPPALSMERPWRFSGNGVVPEQSRSVKLNFLRSENAISASQFGDVDRISEDSESICSEDSGHSTNSADDYSLIDRPVLEVTRRKAGVASSQTAKRQYSQYQRKSAKPKVDEMNDVGPSGDDIVSISSADQRLLGVQPLSSCSVDKRNTRRTNSWSPKKKQILGNAEDRQPTAEEDLEMQKEQRTAGLEVAAIMTGNSPIGSLNDEDKLESPAVVPDKEAEFKNKRPKRSNFNSRAIIHASPPVVAPKEVKVTNQREKRKTGNRKGNTKSILAAVEQDSITFSSCRPQRMRRPVSYVIDDVIPEGAIILSTFRGTRRRIADRTDVRTSTISRESRYEESIQKQRRTTAKGKKSHENHTVREEPEDLDAAGPSTTNRSENLIAESHEIPEQAEHELPEQPTESQRTEKTTTAERQETEEPTKPTVRRRGRKPKHVAPPQEPVGPTLDNMSSGTSTTVRRRGRPKNVASKESVGPTVDIMSSSTSSTVRRRGRPKKVAPPKESAGPTVDKISSGTSSTAKTFADVEDSSEHRLMPPPPIDSGFMTMSGTIRNTNHGTNLANDTEKGISNSFDNITSSYNMPSDRTSNTHRDGAVTKKKLRNNVAKKAVSRITRGLVRMSRLSLENDSNASVQDNTSAIVPNHDSPQRQDGVPEFRRLNGYKSPSCGESISFCRGQVSYDMTFIGRIPSESDFHGSENIMKCESINIPGDNGNSGYMRIPPRCHKRPSVASKYTLFYNVVSGCATVWLDNVVNTVNQGEHFCVPKGLQYTVRNMDTEEPLILFYVRAKYV